MLGKDSGKILDIRGLRRHKVNIINQTASFLRSHLCNTGFLPHGVGQRQHPQAEKVNRQQEVDVLLGKHLHVEANGKVSGLRFKDACRRLKGGIKENLEEEVEAKQCAAGDDGEPGSVATRDGLGHVGPVLERRDGGREGRTQTDESEDPPGQPTPAMTGFVTFSLVAELVT